EKQMNYADLEEALSRFDLAISYDEASFLVSAGKATVLVAMGRYDEALEACNTAISVSVSEAGPPDTLALELPNMTPREKDRVGALASLYILRAEIYQAQGRVEESTNDFARSLKLSPSADALERVLTAMRGFGSRMAP